MELTIVPLEPAWKAIPPPPVLLELDMTVELVRDSAPGVFPDPLDQDAPALDPGDKAILDRDLVENQGAAGDIEDAKVWSAGNRASLNGRSIPPEC